MAVVESKLVTNKMLIIRKYLKVEALGLRVIKYLNNWMIAMCSKIPNVIADKAKVVEYNLVAPRKVMIDVKVITNGTFINGVVAIAANATDREPFSSLRFFSLVKV